MPRRSTFQRDQTNKRQSKLGRTIKYGERETDYRGQTWNVSLKKAYRGCFQAMKRCPEDIGLSTPAMFAVSVSKGNGASHARTDET